MRGSLIQALVCWIGAGVIWVASNWSPTLNELRRTKGGIHERRGTERNRPEHSVRLEKATADPASFPSTSGGPDHGPVVIQASASTPENRPAVNPNTRTSATSVRSKRSFSVGVKTVRAKVTAYCLCKICCGKWAKLPNRVTSIGDNAKVYDGVAADPKLLPYRTRLEIPGIGIKEVDDTGGGMRQSARKGIYHIDVRMPSHSQARRWGVKWLQVKILE